jgi:hypothetical protein
MRVSAALRAAETRLLRMVQDLMLTAINRPFKNSINFALVQNSFSSL